MTERVETKIVLGMPHLLSDGSLNLNQVSKILGDLHWHYMSKEPSKVKVNGMRVYQSFLRTSYSLSESNKEDDEINITTTGNYIDDYIFKTKHVWGENYAELFSIGIHVDHGKIFRAQSSGIRNREFWDSHKKSRGACYKDGVTKYGYPTYPSIDFNAAGILYCANYLKFVYQYADDVHKKVRIKNIDFFGNIKPYDSVCVIEDGDIFIESDGKIIAKCICDMEDI